MYVRCAANGGLGPSANTVPPLSQEADGQAAGGAAKAVDPELSTGPQWPLGSGPFRSSSGSVVLDNAQGWFVRTSNAAAPMARAPSGSLPPMGGPNAVRCWAWADLQLLIMISSAAANSGAPAHAACNGPVHIVSCCSSFMVFIALVQSSVGPGCEQQTETSWALRSCAGAHIGSCQGAAGQ